MQQVKPITCLWVSVISILLIVSSKPRTCKMQLQKHNNLHWQGLIYISVLECTCKYQAAPLTLVWLSRVELSLSAVYPKQTSPRLPSPTTTQVPMVARSMLRTISTFQSLIQSSKTMLLIQRAASIMACFPNTLLTSKMWPSPIPPRHHPSTVIL